MKTTRSPLGARLTFSVLFLILFDSQVLTTFAQGTTFRLLTSLTNPAPAASDWFGQSVAAVGSDKMLIGAMYGDAGTEDAGAVYLYSISGTLLTTFTNPTPVSGDLFGKSVAAVGSDKVLIGAPNDDTGAEYAGAAYLFSTNSTLLITFTNPTPATFDSFGESVAVVGSDKVIIGASFDDTGAYNSGVAYLFGTNGTLLTTFTNPTPGASDWFGQSVAAVGSDKVLIGASPDDTGALDAGAAYLFSTNGTLLTTFTNPTPAHAGFGIPVAAVGSDKVLIGAPNNGAGALDAGAAYLFSNNGTLLTTFTNPTPAYQDFFGSFLAAAGTDKVFISAVLDDTGATNAGAVYLFCTNGTLLTTLTNPTAATDDYFGYCVAVLSSDKVCIGAPFRINSGPYYGGAYLFSVGPLLSIGRTATNSVTVSWPSPWTDFNLQQNTNGITTANWSNVLTMPVNDGTTKTVIVNPPTDNRFYRLFKP